MIIRCLLLQERMDSYQLLLSSSDCMMPVKLNKGQREYRPKCRKHSGNLKLESMFARAVLLFIEYFTVYKICLISPKLIKCLPCAGIVLRALASKEIKVPSPPSHLILETNSQEVDVIPILRF